jgi:hypothetical protein
MAHKESFSDKLVEKLISYQNQIKAISFHGSDKSIKQLLWFLIYTAILKYFKMPSLLEILIKEMDIPPRADGGKYVPIGVEIDNAENYFQEIYGNKYKKMKDWNFSGPLFHQTDKIYHSWYGLYKGETSSIINVFGYKQEMVNTMLQKMRNHDFSEDKFSSEERKVFENLKNRGWFSTSTHEVRRGAVGEQLYIPNFIVFTHKQNQELEDILDKIYTELETDIDKVLADIKKKLKELLPKRFVQFESTIYPILLSVYISDIMGFAYYDGKLYNPQDDDEWARLTFVVEWRVD